MINSFFTVLYVPRVRGNGFLSSELSVVVIGLHEQFRQLPGESSDLLLFSRLVSSFLFFLVQQSADTGVHLALSELLQQRADGFIHT